jgi:hypothetical protein
MGAAAYNRGSNAIRESIGRERKPADPLSFIVARQEDRIKQLEVQVAKLESELGRAKRLICMLRIAKHDMYIKLTGMQDTATEIKRGFLSKKSYAHAYGAMIMAHRLGLI